MSEPNDPTPPPLGDVAPDFEVLDSDGNRQSLSRLCAERPQILLFYRGHW